MKQPQMNPRMALRDKARAQFIDDFLRPQGQEGVVPNSPLNVYAANPVPSKFAVPNDISANQQVRRTPYEDETRIDQGQGDSLMQIVAPVPAATRIMAGEPGKNFDVQPNVGFPTSEVTRRFDMAMQQNVPPPQNTTPPPVLQEPLGMSTSVAPVPGLGPQRDVPRSA